MTSSILFVHNNFPAQFGWLAMALAKRGHACAAIGSQTARPVPGVRLIRWRLTRGTTPGFQPSLAKAQADLMRAEAAAAGATALKRSGFSPDIIIGHPGWGETMFLKEIFPNARFIAYGEYYYRSSGGDVGFDPEFGALDDAARFRVQAKNATLALAYADADLIVSPTSFQAKLLPEAFQSRLRIIHEGVDLDQTTPNGERGITLSGGLELDGRQPLVTFVSRSLEPMRGFHVFMRSLPQVLAAVPNARILIVGAWDRLGYGASAPEGTTWRDLLQAELAGRMSEERVHFVGQLPHAELLAAFRASACHVYYTYPFVLSWSLLEAMACGCAIVASDTTPLREIIRDGDNGLLLPFFDVDALAGALIRACTQPGAFAQVRVEARRTIEARFDRRRSSLPLWLDAIACA